MKNVTKLTIIGFSLGLIYPFTLILINLTADNGQVPGALGILATITPFLTAILAYFVGRILDRKEVEYAMKEKNSQLLLTNVETFINDLERADYSEKQYKFDNEHLSKILYSLKDKLISQKAEDEKAKWTAEGLAQFSEVFRSSTDLARLSEEFVKHLIHYVGLKQGSVFFLHELMSKEEVLELTACYAFDRKKYLQKTISPGEGLVGQCFLENSTLILKKVPQDYLKITSGLGEANPDFLAIVPIKANEKTEGILEVAGFTALPDYKIKFIEKICEGFASVVRAAKINDRTRALLESTQKQAEELREKEEQARQNLEELHATQEAMERKSAEAEDQNKKLNAILDSTMDTIITINDKGTIETVNQSCFKLLGYTPEELVNRNVSMIMPEPHQSNHDTYLSNYHETGVAKIIGKVRTMEALKKDGRRIPVELAVNSATLGRRTVYTGIIRDISERVRLEAERQEQMEELRAQEEELRQNMEELQAIQEQMSIQLEENQKMRELAEARGTVLGHTTLLSETDLFGTIIYVNDKFCEVAKYYREELIGKPHNTVRHPDMPKELFRLFWQTIKQGEVFRGIIKNRAKDGSHYWVDATIVPIKDKDGKTVKYAGARYHIQDEELALKLYNRQAEKNNWKKL